ncbi:MAG: NapC/NirT family cytochrome c [Chthonomonas sp.]|nr:NapC/NirT family cytochrome c [Chthonomonas sp.]
MKRRLPAIFYNATTLFGMTFATVMFILAVILICFDLFGGFANSYSGLVTYIALPGMMFFGLFIAAIGLWRARRRQKRGELPAELPVIDLNQPRHRFIATSVALGGLVLTALSGFGSYKGYEYTESVQFCGTTCHSVMEPEYTAYQGSPHARVTCAGCHIGEGVDWYVKSKLSGSYQVYSTIFNKYERPIKTPIANLRPAKETCEQCHWPKHFFTQKVRTHDYFLSDEENTEHTTSMLVKIGGGEGAQAQGIHAHMYLDSTISYIATDRERQIIPYVEMKDKSGAVTIYRDATAKLTEAQVKSGQRRVVDCIDCHNRPTHIFHPASQSVDTALSTGLIDKTVPEIKAKAVEVLDAKYATKPEALTKIATELRAYYKETYADFMATGASKLEAAIVSIQAIYKQNYFPEMRTDWRSHNDNLDHLRGNGCFRCHNGKLTSDKGKVISKDCNTCHTFVSQGKPGQTKTNFAGMEFEHPVDIGDEWKNTPCKECHGHEEEEEEPAK